MWSELLCPLTILEVSAGLEGDITWFFLTPTMLLDLFDTYFCLNILSSSYTFGFEI